MKLAAAKTLRVLLRNRLISREPLYGIGGRAAGCAPDLLGLTLDGHGKGIPRGILQRWLRL
jgi:hypothetical protein